MKLKLAPKISSRGSDHLSFHPLQPEIRDHTPADPLLLRVCGLME